MTNRYSKNTFIMEMSPTDAVSIAIELFFAQDFTKDIEEMRGNIERGCSSRLGDLESTIDITPYLTSNKSLIKKRSHILCPECFQNKLLVENEKDLYCDDCGEKFIRTGENSVRYK